MSALKRAIRIVKHIGRTPVEAACTSCGKTFKAPLTTLHAVADATASLQAQFDVHQCQRMDEEHHDAR